MDDRELEARLSARLQQRFDRAEPSYGLQARIAADRAANPAPAAGRWSLAGLVGARAGMAAATAAVVVVIAGALLVGPRLGVGPWAPLPSGSAPTVGPSVAPSSGVAPSPIPDVVYRLTPVAFEPPKAVGEATASVIEARLRALGYGTFSTALGDELTVTLPGPYDARVVEVMAWNGGAVAYLVPAAQSVGLKVGQSVPSSIARVFANGDVASAVVDPAGQSGPTLKIELRGDAATRLGEATTANVGGSLVIADGRGRIHTLAMIQSAITGGRLDLTMPGEPSDTSDTSADVLGAVLGTDPLPAEWTSAGIAVGADGQPVDVLEIGDVSAVDATFELAGQYGRSGEADNLAGTKQCPVEVQLLPGGGGPPIDVELFSLAPGSWVQSPPELVDIPAETYRLGITAGCKEWAVRLER